MQIKLFGRLQDRLGAIELLPAFREPDRARSFIVLDLHAISPGHLFGRAGATLAVGMTYWLIRGRQGDGPEPIPSVDRA
jgi:hypothetical protein